MLNVPNVQSYMFLIPTINFADHSASNLLLGIGLHSLAESVLLIKLSHYTLRAVYPAQLGALIVSNRPQRV
jgi:hypothetical protein